MALNLKFISSSGTIRSKFNFNKYNKRHNIFFEEKLVTQTFFCYIGKNNIQFTTYLKIKNKNNEPNGQKQPAQ